MNLKKILMAGSFLVSAGATSAWAADCGISDGRLNIIGNEFPAIQTVAAAAQACDGLSSAAANLTADHQSIHIAGMQGDPAEYTSAIVANSSIVALMNEDLIRPLDDLIAAHGQSIPKSQLITINGQVMAVAFMANAQHLFYRADILEQVGAEPPKTYEDVLSVAEKIRAEGILENPLAGTYKAGWNLGQEFVNMYLGHGGSFYEPGSAQVSINNDAGVATLEMLKALSEYMNPDFLTHDSNAAQAEWEAGNAAIMTMWGSRAGVILDAEGSSAEVQEHTKLAAPVTVAGNDQPASTLWWDGWTVAKNISDTDAEATFKALAHASGASTLNAENMTQAVWMIEGYEPVETSLGVFGAITSGTTPYPMLPYHGLLHTALGDNVADFLQGKESAEQTLADIEATYLAAAREKGFVN